MKRTVLTLAAASVLAVSVQAALAQDKAAAPPPAWQQGKPPALAESKLAPLAGKMTETPASEIPIDKLKLPKGFKAEIWASGLVGARAMTFERRPDQDVGRHARHRPRLRSHDRRRQDARTRCWRRS